MQFCIPLMQYQLLISFYIGQYLPGEIWPDDFQRIYCGVCTKAKNQPWVHTALETSDRNHLLHLLCILVENCYPCPYSKTIRRFSIKPDRKRMIACLF